MDNKLPTAFRTIIKKVWQGAIQLIDVTGRFTDFKGKELFQHYGFTSRPLPQAEAILIHLGTGRDNAVVIATEDRRYRIQLEEGEVALYTDEGDYVHFKRGRKMVVNTGTAEVNASASATITSPIINAVASSKINLTTPEVAISGKLTVAGDITSAAQITDANGSMSGIRTTYNSHNHPDSTGSTGVPNQQL